MKSLSVALMFGEMSLALCSFTYISLNSGILPINCLKSSPVLLRERERKKSVGVFRKGTYFRYALSKKIWLLDSTKFPLLSLIYQLQHFL